MRIRTIPKIPGAVIALTCAVLQAQTISLKPSPATLIAGGGEQTLWISTTNLASIPFTATWNGLSRPINVTSSGYLVSVFSVSLTAEDLAISQLGQLALYDGRTDTPIGSVGVPVVYPVAAAATLYDVPRGRIYLSTTALTTPLHPDIPRPADPRFAPNSLIAIDINTGIVSTTLNLNAAGGAIALSDDGTALYVVVAPSTVRRVDPDAFTPVGDFSMTPQQSIFGGLVTPVVKDIAVMPGTNGTLAVQTDTHIGIFDSGTERASTVGGPATGYSNFTRLLFSPDAKYLFVGDSSRFPAQTQAFLIDTSGFTKQTPLTASGGVPIGIVDDTLYTSTGVSLNWRTMLVTGNLDNATSVAVDPVNSRILACFAPLEYAPERATLQAFDLVSQSPLGTLAMPVAPVNMYRFGVDGLIFQATDSILLFHTPLAGPRPTVLRNGIVSAASFLGGSVAGGEIVSIFGSSLGPAAGQSFTVNNRIVNSPPGAQIWFDREPGTVLFANSGQMNAVAPFQLIPGSTVQVQVWNNGIPSAQIPVVVSATFPALFTRESSGRGLAAVVNRDGSINAPAPRGSIVSLWGTGGGIYPDALDGITGVRISWLSANVQVTIGGENAPVFYAGEAPLLVSSVFQLNVQIPADIAPGSSVPVIVNIGGQSSPEGVTLEIR